MRREPAFDLEQEGQRNKLVLRVALWRFQKELQELDMKYVRMTDEEISEVRQTWQIIVTSLRDNLARAGV
jgi:hypothetical protein